MRSLPLRSNVPSPLRAAVHVATAVACCSAAGVGQCVLPGNFTARVNLFAPSNASVLAVRPIDLDGDGRMDLAVNRNAATLELVRNHGNGTFAATPGPSASQFEVADFDGDGLDDLLLTRRGQVPSGGALHWQVVLEFWRNVTTSTTPGFVLADSRVLATPSLALPNPLLGIADLDVDGILDVAVLDRTEIHVVRGAGASGVPAGAFANSIVSPTATGSMFRVELVDVDHDGALDFVSGTGAWIRVNHGLKDPAGRPTGAFAATLVRQLGNASGNTVFADLDGDGWLDHVAAGGNLLELRRGQPGFTFAGPVGLTIPGADMPFVADLDRDGRLEICVPRTTQWWNGNLVFVDDPFVTNAIVTTEIGTGLPTGGAAVDLDGDGWLDFAVGKQNGEVVCGFNGCAGGLPPQVTVVSPNGGESWLGGVQHTVQWTVAGPYATFDVGLSTDGGVTWRPVVRNARGTSCQVWATEPGTGSALVRVQPTGLPSFGDTSDAVFAIGGITAAAAQPFGQGCGVPSGLSTTATLPRFGVNCDVSVAGAVPGVPVAGWLSLPALAPVPIQPGCAFHLEPAFAAVVASAVAAGNGDATLVVPVPVLPALAGLQVIMQPTAFVPAPLVLQVGNPVLLKLGF